MIPKLHQFLFLFLSKQFVTNCCFGQKIKQLIEDIKKIEQDHQRASVHLEKEKKLRCERLKAAQVKKRKKTVSSSGVKEQLWSRLYSAELIDHEASRRNLSCHSFHFLLTLLFCSQDMHIAIVKRQDTTSGMISELMKKSEDYRQASDQMETIAASLPEVTKQLQWVKNDKILGFSPKSKLLKTIINTPSTLQAFSVIIKEIHLFFFLYPIEATKEQIDQIYIPDF